MWRPSIVWLALAACGRDHFDPTHNFAFVTSTVHDPITFGSDLSGADAICAARASEADLAGKYVAFLNTSKINAADRLGNARGWVLVTGEPLADTVDDLVAGLAFQPLRVDELGETVVAGDHPVAAGLHTATSDIHGCNDWTDPNRTYDSFSSDEPYFVETGGHGNLCTDLARVFCFGIGFDVQLAPAPASGPRAFVTLQGFTAGGGLAAADALCNQEAALAGISGTFLAALGTSTASMASRFDLSGPPWVRLDGIPLAKSRLAFMAGELDSWLAIDSAGTRSYGCAITGGAPTTLGSATCGDWTNAAAGPAGGLPNQANGAAFTGAGGSCLGCDGRAPIYCLEP